MKQIVLIIMLTGWFWSGFAQESPADKLFSKYEEKDGFTTVYISGYMLGLFNNLSVDDGDLNTIQDATKGLKEIKILTVDDEELNKKLNFYKEIIDQLPMSQYNVLMSVKEKGQDFKFLVREEKGRIMEFLMIGGGDDNLLMIIKGNMDLKTISNLSKSLDMKELAPLEGIEKK